MCNIVCNIVVPARSGVLGGTLPPKHINNNVQVSNSKLKGYIISKSTIYKKVGLRCS